VCVSKNGSCKKKALGGLAQAFFYWALICASGTGRSPPTGLFPGVMLGVWAAPQPEIR
jgi:hypothetical protein